MPGTEEGFEALKNDSEADVSAEWIDGEWVLYSQEPSTNPSTLCLNPEVKFRVSPRI